MKHLSALDAVFLHLETPETPMHVGSLMLLDRPPGRKKPYAAIRDHIARRLHLAPVFSRKLAFMPLDLANPVWLDADEIDLDHHIRGLTLPAPGTDTQLEDAVAKLHEATLDRARPLWQFTVIEGLASGKVAFYAKIHHAALDGQGGIAVAQALLDAEKRPKEIGPRPSAAEQRPGRRSAVSMLGAALRNTVAQYGRMVRGVPDVVKAAARGGAVALSSAQLRKRGITLGPRTPLNAAISPRRAFVTAQIPLAEAKAIARHFDAKLNDVVLATCAGALRRHFKSDKGALAKAMVGAIPVSLRAPGDTTQANYVSMMLVSLATNVADPAKRMAAICAASTRAKTLTGSMKGAIPTDMPSLGIPWLMARITPLYRKAATANRIPVIANLVISNVPGPQAPLYLAGAELRAYYPVSIVTHGLALNVTIVSYHGTLDYGLVSARQSMPNLRQFARHLKQAHEELMKIAGKG
ncbi:MAG: wax ester/triacylglycerol synthase family O-acyltransferase [Pseudomonadota bacterium]|nr:wax ester/triacylglycerol synthase family O-acyltransferase [Pseudomonadota bacterium]